MKCMINDLDVNMIEERQGILVHDFQTAESSDESIVLRMELTLAAYDTVSYFAQMQDYDPAGMKGIAFPSGANRLQCMSVKDPRHLRDGGMFVVVRYTDKAYMVLLPMSGLLAMSWFAGSENGLELRCGTFGRVPLEGEVPLLAWAMRESPYAAAREAWRMALEHPLMKDATPWRWRKYYPEVFEYLGWCSWEEYRKDINEHILSEAVDKIEESSVPIRFVLIDDGYLSHRNDQLTAFEPDADRFPNGWKPLLARRSKRGIRWMGLWQDFNGYWRGVAPENNLGPINEHLIECMTKFRKLPEPIAVKMPRPGQLHSDMFYRAMVRSATDVGFDFLKVDDQAQNIRDYSGSCNVAAKAVENQLALESACAIHGYGLINCMAHNPACVFHTRRSVVTRCSEDYLKGDLPRARRHLHNSYQNMIYFGHTVWGDHDMYHSCDEVAGGIMARSKAVSGGPVYLSDSPDKFVMDNIMPLCDADGKLYRPLAPASALPESVFLDPFVGGAAFRVIAPMANGAAVVINYNLTEPECGVTGYVSARDYSNADVLLQKRVWPEMSDEGVVFYDWHEQSVKEGEGIEKQMDDFSDWMVFLLPVRKGWALVGRVEKYLSPATCELLSVRENEMLLRLAEPGPLRVWRRDGDVSCAEGDCIDLGDGQWEIRPTTVYNDTVLRLVVS